MTNQANHHEVNPHYRPQPTNNPDNDAEVFRLAIRDSYAKLNARREAQYESELVPPVEQAGRAADSSIQAAARGRLTNTGHMCDCDLTL